MLATVFSRRGSCTTVVAPRDACGCGDSNLDVVAPSDQPVGQRRAARPRCRGRAGSRHARHRCRHGKRPEPGESRRVHGRPVGRRLSVAGGSVSIASVQPLVDPSRSPSSGSSRARESFAAWPSRPCFQRKMRVFAARGSAGCSSAVGMFRFLLPDWLRAGKKDLTTWRTGISCSRPL